MSYSLNIHLAFLFSLFSKNLRLVNRGVKLNGQEKGMGKEYPETIKPGNFFYKER